MVQDNTKKLTTEVIRNTDNNLFDKKDCATKPNELSNFDASMCSAAKVIDEPVKGDIDVDLHETAHTFGMSTRCFYFVKVPIYDGPQLNLKIDQADEEVSRRWEVRFQTGHEVHMKVTERTAIMNQLKLLATQNNKSRKILDSKIKEQVPQQRTQDKMRRESTVNYEKAGRLCSSKQELNDLICSLRHQMQHQRNSLVSEKKIIREIQEIVEARDKVIANEKMEAERDYVGNQSKEFYRNFSRTKSIEARNELMDSQATSMRIALNATEQRIISLKEAMKPMKRFTTEAYETSRELRKQRDGVEAYHSVMAKAREHAENKDVVALEELCRSEMEKFMFQWNTSYLFREDYKKRVIPCHNSRR